MLELEIVPERSIGCEQWEFILGESLIKKPFCVSVLFINLGLVINYWIDELGLWIYFTISKFVRPSVITIWWYLWRWTQRYCFRSMSFKSNFEPLSFIWNLNVRKEHNFRNLKSFKTVKGQNQLKLLLLHWFSRFSLQYSCTIQLYSCTIQLGLLIA